MAIPRLPAPINAARPPAPPSPSAVAAAILGTPRLPAAQPVRPPATTGGNRPSVIEGTARVVYPTTAKAPNFASMNWLSTNLRQNGAGQWVLPRSSANPADMANTINMKSTQAALAKVGNLRGPEAVKKLESMATTPAARKAIYIGLPLLAATGAISWLTVAGFSDEVPSSDEGGAGFGGGNGLGGDGLPPLPDGGSLPGMPLPPLDGGLPPVDMGAGLPSVDDASLGGTAQGGVRTFLSLSVSKTQLGSSVAFSFSRGPVPIVDKGFQVGSYHYPLSPVLLDDGARETVRALKSRMNGETIVTVALVTELVRQLGVDAVVSLFAERN